MPVIDADAHLDEHPDLWRTYTPGAEQELALYVTEDELGYPWLTVRGRRLYLLDVFEVGGWSRPGELRQRWRAGLPATDVHRLDSTPVHDRDPLARLDRMTGWGVDEAVLFPNRGFNWEAFLADDLDALRVNCAAWNRWAVEVTQAGRGRLHPVGHVVLDGGRTPWLEEQLRTLSSAGVRQVMVSPGLIGGVRPSDQVFDPLWSLFVEEGVALTWHVHSRMGSIFDHGQAWWSNDRDSHVQLLGVLFAPTAAQMTLADFAVNGVFERHPELRVVTAELGAEWALTLLPRIDSLYTTWDALTGRPFNPALGAPPSEYVLRQVTAVCSFPTDVTPAVVAAMDGHPTTFAFATDHPHPEGLSTLDDYRARVGTAVPEHHEGGFFGGNIARVLWP